MKVSAAEIENVFFRLLYIVLLLLVTLGELFYDLYATELSLVLLTIMFFFWLAAKDFKIRYIYKPMMLLLWLFGLYLCVSMFFGREMYYIARQGVLVLYVLFFVIMVTLLINSPVLFFDRFMNRLKGLTIIGTISYIFWSYIIGVHAPNTAFVFLLFGYVMLIHKLEGELKVFLITTLYATGITLSVTHSSFLLAIIAAYLVRLTLLYRNSYWLLLSTMVILVLGTLSLYLAYVFVPDFSNFNALLRLEMWVAYVVESWSRGYFLLGQGFGGQLVPETMENLVTLALVNEGQPKEWMLMVVPAHNTYLMLLKYAGLPALVLFFLPLVYIWKVVVVTSKDNNVHLHILFGSLVALMTIGFFNQFLGAPYFSVPFFTLYALCTAKAFTLNKDRSAYG